MPATSALVLGGLALGLLLLGKKDEAWSDDAYKDMTEFRQTPQGMARYFKAQFVPSIAAKLGTMHTGEMKSTMVGGQPLTIIELLPGAGSATSNALVRANSAYKSGLAVFVEVNIWSQGNPKVFMMTAAATVRASFARKGKPWAVLADPQYPLPSPGTPGTPGTPATPGTPGTPGTPAAPPFPGLPPGMSIPPGVIPPGMSIPGIPGTPPGGTTPSTPSSDEFNECLEFLDDNMPASEKQLACHHLLNENASVESHLLAAQACDFRGYPLCAEANREAARRKGWKDGGEEPIVPDAQHAPFKIRKNDIPYKLAEYYTGNSARVKEILEVNPGMKSVTKGGTTFYEPWNVGEIILLPASWKVPTKPLPKPASTKSSGVPYTPPIL